MFWPILFLLFGFVLLIKSADFLVDGAAGAAQKLRIPKLVVALTLVAFGTSAPEGTVSVIAALENSPDLSVGNIIGSNIANIALILGLSSVLRVLPISKNSITKGIPLNILAGEVLIILGFDTFFQNHGVSFNRFTLGDGIIFLSFFIIYLYYIYADLKVAEAQEHEIEKKEKKHFKDAIWYLAVLIMGGMAGIMVGGKLVVDNALVIAKILNISEGVIGLSIVAIGTSLPELATSVMAAIKKESEIAVGNIIGSNAFNIFLVLGVTSIIHPINFDAALLFDGAVMMFISVLFFLFAWLKKNISRREGAILLGCYVLYLASLGLR